MKFKFGDVVTVHRATVTGRDDYGNDVITYVDEEVTGCAIYPRPFAEKGEALDGRDTVTTGVAVLFPVPMGAQDEVTLRGVRYRVDGGDSEDYRSPLTGTRAGYEVALVRVTG